MATRVLNLATGDELLFTCSPREAVMVAYAESQKDGSTWQYEERYGALVEEGEHIFLCGDFAANKVQKK